MPASGRFLLDTNIVIALLGKRETTRCCPIWTSESLTDPGHIKRGIHTRFPALWDTAPCLDPTASAMIAVTKLLMLTPSRCACLVSLA